MNKNKNVCRPTDEDFVQKKKKKFRLVHLLGILYAALRFLGEPVLVSDLVRWVLEGHLPFYGTSDVLPKDITGKFDSSGTHVFLVAKPDLLYTSKLQEPVSHVLSVLDIDLPVFDHLKLDFVIGRFISSLHLPASFLQITHHLMTKYPATVDHPRNKKKKNKKEQFEIEEGPALAYIIVAMKLLFGLDGHTEVLSSEIGRIVRNKLPTGSKVVPFIFEEWMACEKLRAKHHQIKTNIFSHQACREVSDVSRFIDQHSKSFLLNSKRETLYKAVKYQGQSLGSEMQRPFMKVRDQGEPSGQSCIHDAPSSFPYPGNGLDQRSERESNSTESGTGIGHGAVPSATNGVHWISKNYLASCNFSRSSVDYLVNLTKFCKKNDLDLESVLSDERLKKIMSEKKAESDAGGSEQRGGKRKKAGSKAKGKGETPGHQDEDDSDPAAASEGTSKHTRTKRKRIRREEDNTGNGNLRTMKGAGTDSMSRSDVEELPYEQWKQMVLSRTEEADVSKDNPGKSSTGLVSYSVSYTRYKPVSVKQAKASMYQDGEPAAWRPFHRSYQWLLEHCAALLRLDWMYIHEAVAALENRIFDLEGHKIWTH
ncbi:uncharacterized protein LOC121425585 [Lytechinus variegatus]|uniref:uncharacterized protein LOC121425585 n=1 Tax=Lytechinus variegatus TaxID=7654 RepID=UPI001BB2BDA1|nr:uncharacterized protein LOC121425585 [Lytechinus variegatus]